MVLKQGIAGLQISMHLSRSTQSREWISTLHYLLMNRTFTFNKGTREKQNGTRIQLLNKRPKTMNSNLERIYLHAVNNDSNFHTWNIYFDVKHSSILDSYPQRKQVDFINSRLAHAATLRSRVQRHQCCHCVRSFASAYEF